jgi:hypothetical protein
MSDMYYDPNILNDERWLAAAEAYEESDDYLSDAWDALTSQPGPPDWLLDRMGAWYTSTSDYETKVQDRIDGER